jgi:hypothetical protein
MATSLNSNAICMLAAAIACAAGLGYSYEDPTQAAAVPVVHRGRGITALFDQHAGAAQALLPLPAPQAAPLPRSYESAADLHQFFMLAKASNDPAIAYQAYRAYFQCQALVSNASNLRAAYAGGDRTDFPGDLTPERGAAAEEVLKRCHGFERMSERELNEAGQALRARLLRMGSVEAKMDALDVPPLVDRATLDALLETHTASAFELAERSLSALLRDELKVAFDSDEAGRIDTALMLAACDMGKDCSASSFGTLLQCAYYGTCQATPFDWQAGLDQAGIERVLELKKRIVDGIARGRYR